MRDALIAGLFVVVLVAGVRSGLTLVLREQKKRWRVPFATIAALVIIGVPTLLQFTVAPSLVDHLQRDRAAIGDGQIWRLVTALVVQDGGVPGTVFNLVALAIVGAVAEQVWGTKRWIAIALVSGLGAELWGLLVQPIGAGNSVVVFGLAASMATAALKGRGERGFALACLIGSAILLGIGDIHGGAATIGALMGLLLAGVPLQRLTFPVGHR